MAIINRPEYNAAPATATWRNLHTSAPIAAPVSVTADDYRIARANPTLPASPYYLPRATTPAATTPSYLAGMPSLSGTAIRPTSVPSGPSLTPMSTAGPRVTSMPMTGPSVTNLSTAGPRGVSLSTAGPSVNLPAYLAQVPSMQSVMSAGESVVNPSISAALAAQGDWGMNAAAQAQVDLIRAWGDSNLAAAAESEIARGMGRSGAYDASRDRVAQQTRMEAANQLAQAAAEQGRLNQEVALTNAQLGTQANIAQGNALIEAAAQRTAAQTAMQNFYLGALQQNEAARQAQLDANISAYNAQTGRAGTLNDFALGSYNAQTQRAAANNQAAIDAYNAVTARGGSNNDAAIAAYNAVTQRGGTINEGRIAAYNAATNRYSAQNDARIGAYNASTNRYGTIADASIGRYNALTGRYNADTSAGQLALERQTSTPSYLESIARIESRYAAPERVSTAMTPAGLNQLVLQLGIADNPAAIAALYQQYGYQIPQGILGSQVGATGGNPNDERR